MGQTAHTHASAVANMQQHIRTRTHTVARRHAAMQHHTCTAAHTQQQHTNTHVRATAGTRYPNKYFIDPIVRAHRASFPGYCGYLNMYISMQQPVHKYPNKYTYMVMCIVYVQHRRVGIQKCMRTPTRVINHVHATTVCMAFDACVQLYVGNFSMHHVQS